MASIFNLLENQPINPLSTVNSKITLVEHITEKQNIIKKDSVLNEIQSSDKSTRLITYKVILEKFNEKYKDLADNQKILLKEYVNSVSNSPALKLYINEEIKKIKKQLTKYENKVEDKAVVIKLKETKDLIQPINKKINVHDDNVTNLLNYYELINELKIIHG